MFVTFSVLHRLNQAHQSSYDLIDILLFYWWRAQAIIPILIKTWYRLGINCPDQWSSDPGLSEYLFYNLYNLKFFFEIFHFIYIFLAIGFGEEERFPFPIDVNPPGWVSSKYYLIESSWKTVHQDY